MNWLPANGYLNRETERAFQHSLNDRSRYNIVKLLLILLAMLVFFLFRADYTHVSEQWAYEMPRLAITLLIFPIVILTLSMSNRHLHYLCFYASLGLVVLIGLFFLGHTQSKQELTEGGPMLVAILIASIPILHLGHKLVLWTTYFTLLVLIHYDTQVDLSWTLSYCFLTIAVMFAMQYHQDILLRSQYQLELNEMMKAQTDELTGIPNRHYFEKALVQCHSRLKPGQVLALAMVDIDHFKEYNDRYGHLSGDQILIEVAKLLSQQPADIVVRFGGEEFILVKLFEENDPDCTTWLDDLPEQFAKRALPHQGAPCGYVTVSAGITRHTHESGQPLGKTALISRADRALYQAKSDGRDCVRRQIAA